jgi:hypothetical protein
MGEKIQVSGEIIDVRGAIRVGGRIYNCEGITVRMGTEERSAVVGMLGVAGFKAESVPPEVEATGITCDSGVTAGSRSRATTR